MKVSLFKNSVFGICASVITILAGFIMQRVLIDSLGIDAVGFDNFLKNTVNLLSLSELGFAAAINYHLYRLLSNNDRLAVTSVILFFKKVYRYITILVITISFVVLAVLPYILKGARVNGFSPQICFVIAAAGSVISYLLVYKRSLLIASEQNYVINAVHSVLLVAMAVLQIAVLLTFQNLYLFYLVRVIVTIADNVFLNVIVNKFFPWYGKYTKYAPVISDQLKRSIFTKVKGLVYHKLTTFLVLGSDSIILTVILGLSASGYYSNYLLLLMGVQTVCKSAFVAITPSVGVAVLDGASSSFVKKLFTRLFASNLCAALLVSVGYFTVVNSFIAIWVGAEFVQSALFSFSMASLAFITIMRFTFDSFKEALGVFYEDRFVAVVEAVVNILCGVGLVSTFGIIGVPLATILSTVVLYSWSYYRFVWRKVFDHTPLLYLVTLSGCLVIFLCAIAISVYLCSTYGEHTGAVIDVVVNTVISVVSCSPFIVMLYLRFIRKSSVHGA